MVYADGLLILFQFGGIYAAGTFGLDFSEILVFGIFMNISAGFGAFIFGWIDDRFGSKITVITSLLGLIVCGSAILIATDIILFWSAGLTLSFFIGPTQASSRTLLSRITPPSIQVKMYGLYSMSGKCTSFLGPMLFGWATLLFESQRAGMAVAIIFWIIGLVVLFFVREDYSSRELSPNHLSK
jgi:UMF1 family MFS transporter